MKSTMFAFNPVIDLVELSFCQANCYLLFSLCADRLTVIGLHISFILTYDFVLLRKEKNNVHKLAS